MISFAEGVKQIAEWYLADPERQVVDPEFDVLATEIAQAYA